MDNWEALFTRHSALIGFSTRNLLDLLYLILYYDSLLFDYTLLVWQSNSQNIVDKIHRHDRSFE